MPCYKPTKCYKLHNQKTANGKAVISFKRPVWCEPFEEMQVPCGGCVGCRINHSRTWALRCYHEASLYDSNCFITLTFRDDCLDPEGSLRKPDFQKFMKRLRKEFPGRNIRYYHCGEYGSELQRPHHHACLFNFDFPDKTLWTIRDNTRLYRSRTLERLWPFGFCTIGEVTFQSAAYVARYIHKKITGKSAKDHYIKVDPESGEIFKIQPEYTTMSRRPGIGKGWFDKHGHDCFPKDFLTIEGKKFKPPSYYDRLYGEQEPEKMDEIKERRRQYAKQNGLTSKQLANAEEATSKRVNKMKRGIE